MEARLKILAAAVGTLLLLGGAGVANAQAFKLNQVISPIKAGVLYSNGIGTSTVFATTSPTISSFTATSSSATSYIAGNLTISGTLNLAALAGGGSLCLHVSNTGVVGVAAGDCGTASAITTLGPTGQGQTGPSIVIATSTLSFNGLTIGDQIVGNTNTITWKPVWTGTLNNAGLTNSTIGATSPNSTLSIGSAAALGSTFTADLNLATANNWTGLQRFLNASSTQLSAFTKAYFGGTATSTFDSAGVLTLATPLTVASGGTGAGTITGLVVGNGTSAMTAYAGVTCVNQFLRALSAAGASTCATVGAADVSLAALTATDSTLTFSGSYTGATARTIGLNLGNANIWTALQRFTGNASSTMESVFGPAYFGATATSTFDSAGVLTLATPLAVGSGGTGSTTLSSGSLIYGRGTTQVGAVATSSIGVSAGLTNTGTLGSQVGGTALTLKQLENRSFTASSTAPLTAATTTIPLEIGYGEVWNTIKCFTDTGTVVVQFGYGTASTSAFTASTTIGTITPASNNTMTSGNQVKVDIGTAASSPNKLTCTINDTI